VKQQKQTPVFFGSGYNNFGVQQFLDKFLEIASTPMGRVNTGEGGEGKVVAPETEDFSGFVFKLQANMDPRHRDRIAFVRVCSLSIYIYMYIYVCMYTLCDCAVYVYVHCAGGSAALRPHRLFAGALFKYIQRKRSL